MDIVYWYFDFYRGTIDKRTTIVLSWGVFIGPIMEIDLLVFCVREDWDPSATVYLIKNIDRSQI